MINNVDRRRKVISDTNVECDICGTKRYSSGVCPSCGKVICEECEIRITHDGVLDSICPNCRYSFGTSLIFEDRTNH